jgi:hypothetical protein
VLDDSAVTGITSQLQQPGRVTGKAHRLAANIARSYQGSIVLGMGFVLQADDASRLMDQDPRNRDVLQPYLNGEDLNNRWDQSPSRWVINFRDWPLERAREYGACFEIVERLVRPERSKNNRKVYRENWWHYAEKRPELYSVIADSQNVMVCSEVSKYLMFATLPTGYVYSANVDIFICVNQFPLMQSSLHDLWARQYSSTLETRLKYSPGNAYETFPCIAIEGALESIGAHYHSFRQDIMTARREGLTATYNRFHNPREVSEDITTLRALHVEMDQAVAASYGWNDLELGHDFRETKQGLRYTVSEIAKREVLDRLLARNHECSAQEQAASAEPRAKRKKTKGMPEHPELF